MRIHKNERLTMRVKKILFRTHEKYLLTYVYSYIRQENKIFNLKNFKISHVSSDVTYDQITLITKESASSYEKIYEYDKTCPYLTDTQLKDMYLSDKSRKRQDINV